MLILISIVIQTPYLHLLAHTYLHLIICAYVLFMLLYELDKIGELTLMVKIWGI